MRIVGILLIILGLVSLALGGISYTRREKVLDIGPIEATAEAQEHPAATAVWRCGAGWRRRVVGRRIEKEIARYIPVPR